MTKEEYVELVNSHTKNPPSWQSIVARHIKSCAKSVGGYSALYRITGHNDATLRKWRKGARMKAMTALEFELSFNASQDSRIGTSDESLFRCDRKKLIAWFFE